MADPEIDDLVTYQFNANIREFEWDVVGCVRTRLITQEVLSVLVHVAASCPLAVLEGHPAPRTPYVPYDVGSLKNCPRRTNYPC